MTYADIETFLTHRRYERDYIEGSPSLFSNLEAFAGYNSGDRDNNDMDYIFDECGYNECSIMYDDCCYLLKLDLRKGLDIHMNCSQLREVLRLNQMIIKFDSIVNVEDIPSIFPARKTYVEQHPYWIKMTKQANKILELLRKKK